MCIYVYIYIYVSYIYIYIYSRRYTYIYIYTHTCVYIYIYIYTHTHIKCAVLPLRLGHCLRLGGASVGGGIAGVLRRWPPPLGFEMAASTFVPSLQNADLLVKKVMADFGVKKWRETLAD